MSEWFEGKLADVCASIDYGLTASACEEPVGPKFLRITDIVGVSLDWGQVPFVPASESDSNKFKLHSGDIVIARTGATTGESRFIVDPPRAVFASYLVRLKINQQNNPRFISYWLKSPEFRNYLEGVLGDKSAQPNASASTMTQAPIRIPANVEKQYYIASILGALDDKIELNRLMNGTLEAMARAIFKDWFVDFGPTRTKSEGRAPYLAPELWEMFPDALDDENKPAGWKVSPIGERIEILDAKRIPLSSRERKQRHGPYPYHGATGVMDYVDDFLFEGVHILLGEDGSVVKSDGRPFTQYVWGQFWVNNHAHVLRGKDISNEMLLCFLQQADIAPYVTGAVQPKLNQRNLRSIPFSASDNDAAAAFGRVIGPLFDQLRLNTEESRTLAQVRDLLLPKLMSGEIRLQDAEREVETAV